MPEEGERDLIAFVATSLVPGRLPSITVETQLFAERILTSMTILDLIGYVERRLGRRLEDKEIVMANFASVRAIEEAFFRHER